MLQKVQWYFLILMIGKLGALGVNSLISSKRFIYLLSSSRKLGKLSTNLFEGSVQVYRVQEWFFRMRKVVLVFGIWDFCRKLWSFVVWSESGVSTYRFGLSGWKTVIWKVWPSKILCTHNDFSQFGVLFSIIGMKLWCQIANYVVNWTILDFQPSTINIYSLFRTYVPIDPYTWGI